MLAFESDIKKDMIILDNEEYNFVHKDGENYFDIKTICSLLGVSQQIANYHANRYLEGIEIYTKNLCINLKTGKRGKENKLYSFEVITYIAYRVNTKEAIMYRNWAAQALNEKFNKMFEIEELPAVMSAIGLEIMNEK